MLNFCFFFFFFADDLEGLTNSLASFPIDTKGVTELRESLQNLKYMILEEYDFRRDNNNPTLNIDLKPNTSLRPYQEVSLSKMFSQGRARSGM